jgi:hypothetical protein
MTVQSSASVYPARLEVDYPDQHDRVTTLFRVIMVIPIGIVSAVLTAGATQTSTTRADRWCARRAVASPPACSSRHC